jgi:hypothetical protein
MSLVWSRYFHFLCCFLLSLPWLTAESLLEPSERYFLIIAARMSIASPLRRSESSSLDVLPAENPALVDADVEAIRALDLDPVTENLLLAGLFAENELYAAAIDAYHAVLAVQPAPVVAVTLGGMYRNVDPQRFAFNAYAEALRLLDAGPDDPAVRSPPPSSARVRLSTAF